MLTGQYSYKGFNYNIQAYDFEENIAMYLIPIDNRSKLALDNGIFIGEDRDLPSWDKFYVSVGNGNVSCSCYFQVIEGTRYKNEVNVEMVTKLGSILKGMKQSCNKYTRVGDDSLYDVGFVPNKVSKYIFEGKGSMELDMKTILSVYYRSELEDVSLILEEDGSYYEKIFNPASTAYKFKMDLSEFVEEDTSDDWDFDEDGDKVFSLQEIIERNPNKSYVWLQERKYWIVKDIEDVERICKQIWRHDGIVAFDTETTGLNVNVTSRTGDGDRLVGMVFSIKPGEAWYFPVAHKKVKNICTPGNEHYIIEKYFRPLLEQKKLVCHNGAFDWKVMYNYDISINLVHDTLVLFKVTLWNDHRGLKLGLKELTHDFLGRDSFELSDFVSGRFGSNNIKFWDLEEESVKYYACPDTDNLIELLQFALDNDYLGRYGAKKTYEMEVAFSLVIAYQEYYGHCVDVSRIDSLVNEIESSLDYSYGEMVKIAGHDFNPNSSPQLAKILIDELKYPVVSKTDTGNPSTGKDARKAWMREKNPDGTDKYPFAKYLQEYADHATLKSNFTKNLDKFATEDGLCFSKVQQFLETGRVSVKEPNYQSYSDKVKQYIIPRTGFYALDADYSSVEARIMVSMAGCMGMVEKLKDPDMDYHTAKASDMFGVPYELVSKKLRKMSKGVNFGILYGLGDWNLAINLGREGSRENAKWAAKQKELYFKGMEELRSFIDKSKSQGTTQFFSTTYFGRRRYYDPRKTRKDRIERQSCNARIQGTAADIYKLAMIRLFTELRKRKLLGKVLISAFVHDECFLEVHKSLDPCKVLKILRHCMMLEISGWCPLFIGCGYGRNWYEAKKTELPVQVQDKFVNEWGDSGLDWWNGDTDRLYKWEINEINNYRSGRVIRYLRDENNWNGVLNPVINTLTYEVMEEIKDGVDVEGVVDRDVEIVESDMIENLKQFCKAFGMLDIFDKANIHKPEHKEVPDSASEENDEEEHLEYTAEDIIKMRLKTLGVCISSDGNGKKIYFKYSSSDRVFMSIIHKIMVDNPGDMEVLAVKEDNQIYSTGLKVNSSVYPRLVQLYVQRGSMVG